MSLGLTEDKLLNEIEQLKANEQRYIELLLSTKERLIRYGKGGFVDPNCIAMDIGDALAQSPQQVEVYRAERAVIAAAIDWWKYDQIAAELLEAVGKLQATIDKADKGE
jgi:hypothetical protein